jgi:hypothetical protein
MPVFKSLNYAKNVASFLTSTSINDESEIKVSLMELIPCSQNKAAN